MAPIDGDPGRTPRERAPSDAQLVAQARAGNEAAFCALVQRYEKTVGLLAYQRLGRRQDAEDATQETFIKAYLHLRSLEDPARFGPWLYGIAFRVAMDALRRRRRRRRHTAASLDELVGEHGPGRFEGEDPSAPEQAVLREEAALLLAAIGALPDADRLVLTLRYYRHMRYREIAEHLGQPPGTIANRLHRAIRRLRARMRPSVSGYEEGAR